MRGIVEKMVHSRLYCVSIVEAQGLAYVSGLVGGACYKIVPETEDPYHIFRMVSTVYDSFPDCVPLKCHGEFGHHNPARLALRRAGISVSSCGDACPKVVAAWDAAGGRPTVARST